MNHTLSYEDLFERYWQWLLQEFRSGSLHEYSPVDGNRRRVEYMDSWKIKLRETTSRGAPSECSMIELREDFRKLYEDPEVNAKGVKALRKQHGAKDLAEFKRDMFFREFKQFEREASGNTQVVAPSFSSRLKPADNATSSAARQHQGTRFGPKQRTIMRLANTVRDTVAGAYGQQALRTVKNKECRFGSAHDLKNYIAALISDQHGRCAITGLPLQFDDESGDPELLCSLDRIDSDGHYEPGNLQVVCRFVNRWKNDENDTEFRRLIDLIRSAGDSVNR